MFDFPGIYKEANDISIKTQKDYLLILKIFLTLLLISAVIFSYFSNIWEIRLVNAILSLILLTLSFVFYFFNFQGAWYSARAVAESIKTICWRYATRADPYNCNDDEARDHLIETIKHIVDMNLEFKKHLSAKYSSLEQLPETMAQIRSLSQAERLEYYFVNRVIEQRDWYGNKSKENNTKAVTFYAVLILISLLLSVLLFIDLDKSNTIKYPIDILLSLISIFFTWVQTRKYRELDKSYALAAYEIGFIASQKHKINTEEKLSTYVMNSENAFSREHTQWLARKDN